MRLLAVVLIDRAIEDYIDGFIRALVDLVLEPVVQQARPMPALEIAVLAALVDVEHERPEPEQLVQPLHQFGLDLFRVREDVVLNLSHVVPLLLAHEVVVVVARTANVALAELNHCLVRLRP